MIKHGGEITLSQITGYTSFSGTHLEWETAERVVAQARTVQIFNSFGDEVYRSAGGEKSEESPRASSHVTLPSRVLRGISERHYSGGKTWNRDLFLVWESDTGNSSTTKDPLVSITGTFFPRVSPSPRPGAESHGNFQVCASERARARQTDRASEPASRKLGRQEHTCGISSRARLDWHRVGKPERTEERRGEEEGRTGREGGKERSSARARSDASGWEVRGGGVGIPLPPHTHHRLLSERRAEQEAGEEEARNVETSCVGIAKIHPRAATTSAVSWQPGQPRSLCALWFPKCGPDQGLVYGAGSKPLVVRLWRAHKRGFLIPFMTQTCFYVTTVN